MPGLSRNTLNKHEQQYWDEVLERCSEILENFGFTVYPETIFKSGKSIGAFRSLLKARTYPKNRMERKVIDVMMRKTETAYVKEYHN